MSLRLGLALAAIVCACAQTAKPGKNAVTIRGQRQDVYYLPARAPARDGPCVLFAPGDGGWRGFAVDIAQTVASWGYEVTGFDTKRYLESFTTRQSTLDPPQVMADMKSFGDWAAQVTRRPVIFVGWSEGAALGVLALAAPANKKVYRGLATIGLTQTAELGWRLADDITYITKKNPNEPMFSTTPYLPMIAPLPLFMIDSTGDEYTPAPVSKQLFAAARDPKKYSLIEARNHRFDGNRDAFFNSLREGLAWVAQQSGDR
jgi:dienelactone hydrolase